jgi:hypothetical protein
MKLRIIILAILALAVGITDHRPALAAGSCTGVIEARGDYRDIVWTWQSDASGNVSGVGAVIVYGIVDSLFFDSDNDATPTNLYDVQLRTDSGENVIAAGGINYGADIPVAKSDPGRRRQPLNSDGDYIRLFGESISPYITGAGANKKGVIKMRVW